MRLRSRHEEFRPVVPRVERPRPQWKAGRSPLVPPQRLQPPHMCLKRLELSFWRWNVEILAKHK